MTDLELCERIAEIEDENYIRTQYEKGNFIALVSRNDFTGNPQEMIARYDPLNDDARCFGLMKKYNICLDIKPTDNGDPIAWSNVMAISISDKSPNKAICLAIIEANT